MSTIKNHTSTYDSRHHECYKAPSKEIFKKVTELKLMEDVDL